MNNSFALRTAIAEYADGMRVAGRVVDAKDAAQVLSARYPRSGLTMVEIVWEIEKASVAAGATLFSRGIDDLAAFPKQEIVPEFDAYLSAPEKEQFS